MRIRIAGFGVLIALAGFLLSWFTSFSYYPYVIGLGTLIALYGIFTNPKPRMI